MKKFALQFPLYMKIDSSKYINMKKKHYFFSITFGYDCKCSEIAKDKFTKLWTKKGNIYPYFSTNLFL
jgi:hypothetical protein